MICAPPQNLFRSLNEEELDGRGMWYIMWKRELHKGFWWGYLTESVSPRNRREDKIKIDLILNARAWPVLISVTMGSRDAPV